MKVLQYCSEMTVLSKV